MANKASTLLARGGITRSHQRGLVKSLTAGVIRVVTAAVAARGHWLVPFIIGLFLGRATVLGAMKPFGTAYVMALAAVGLRSRALMAGVGAIVGAVTSTPVIAGVEPLPTLLVVWCVTAVAGRYFRLSPPIVALGALLGAASLRIVAAAFGGGDLVLAGAATAAEMMALIVLFPFVHLWTHRPAELSRGQVMSVLIVVGVLVLGTEGIYLYQYSLTEILMRGTLLAAALVGGIGVGAAAGATAAMLTVLGAGGLTWTTALLSPAGLLAGIGAHFGRPGAFVGLLTAHLLLSPYAADGGQIAAALTHCLLAGGLIGLVPRWSFGLLSRRVPDTPEAHRARRERRHSAELAARQHLRKIAGVLEDVGRSLARSRYADTRGGEGGFDRFVIDVSDRVCVGCPHHSVCWDTYVYQTYRDLLSTAAAISASGAARLNDLPNGLQQRCIRPDYLTSGISRLLMSMKHRDARVHASSDELQHTEVYKAAPRQFAGIAGIIGSVARQLEHLDSPIRGERDNGQARGEPRYQLVVDAAQAPGDGSAVSGDCFRRVDLPSNRVALIVSDGMGSGARAAVESEAAVAMLERFLIEGFDLFFAVQMINSVLLLRSPEETFATLDVCLFDLNEGTVRMLKTGAAPTYIRRGNHVDIVRADSLPVGILQAVEANTVEYRLGAGDLVVMVTDGVLELGSTAGDKAEAVGRALRRLDQPTAHEAVDGLFKRAQSAAGQKIPDDVTVVAGQLLPL